MADHKTEVFEGEQGRPKAPPVLQTSSVRSERSPVDPHVNSPSPFQLTMQRE